MKRRLLSLSSSGGSRGIPSVQSFESSTPFRGFLSAQIDLPWLDPPVSPGSLVAGCLSRAVELLGNREDVSSLKGLLQAASTEQPLRQEAFENLRIISDALWFAAQKRLAKNKAVRGRKSTRRTPIRRRGS